MVMEFQLSITGMCCQHHGKQLISHLKASATETKGKRALARFRIDPII